MMKLLTPVTIGAVTLPNRVVMAPLTRSRAGQPGDVPTGLNAEYYAQRASAGLIVSEGTVISDRAQGYAFTPGIFTEAQVAGWQEVVAGVHAKGGHMSMQLWHVGRYRTPCCNPTVMRRWRHRPSRPGPPSVFPCSRMARQPSFPAVSRVR